MARGKLCESSEMPLALCGMADRDSGVAIGIDLDLGAIYAGDSQQAPLPITGAALSGLFGDDGHADAAILSVL